MCHWDTLYHSLRLGDLGRISGYFFSIFLFVLGCILNNKIFVQQDDFGVDSILIISAAGVGGLFGITLFSFVL